LTVTIEELDDDEVMNMIVAGFIELAKRQEVPILHVVDECRKEFSQAMDDMETD